jgi:hypothetical protein
MKNQFKIITIISYCLITFSSTHFGAPLLFMVLVGLLGGEIVPVIQSVSIIGTLIFFIYSYVKPKRNRDLYLFTIGGAVLFLPIVEQCFWLKEFERKSFFDDKTFAAMTLVFLFFLLINIVSIYREKNNQ